jgi:DNA-binding beta-propeller fold protein YncE
MDAGPRGRMYVLDAGNARIVVFDRDGEYITEFGSAGSGDGQFDFGTGEIIGGGLNFSGSIAVDDDGFIYVADVGNRRIQKFAP